MSDAIETFGIAAAGVDYRLRPGGYVVLRNDAGEVAVLVTRTGVFLPGGGQERDETPEAAAVRETLEECALRVTLGARIGVADELVFGEEERTYFRKRCTFFAATLVARDPDVVPEDEVTWLPPADAVARLRDGSQRWAVTRACEGC